MTQKHIIKRGAHYHYVRRVPLDLSPYFPSPLISRSLHTKDKKYATIVAAAWEYRTDQLFMQLRSGMLDRHLIEHLITQYLQAGLVNLEARTYGRPYKPGAIRTSLDFLLHPLTEGIPVHRRLERAERMRVKVANKEFGLGDQIVASEFEPYVKRNHGKKLSKAEKHELSVRVLHADRQLTEFDAAVKDGRLESLEILKDKIRQSRPYLDLSTVIKSFEEKYRIDKGSLKKRADKQLTVDLDVILDIFDNVSIDTVNSAEGITFCKKILRRYPLNCVQRFNKKPAGWVEGDKPYKRSIHSILSAERGYETIAPQTANGYIKRIIALINHAIKYEDYDKPNRWIGELFDVSTSVTGDDTKRSAYDQEDINNLISALCEQPLWRYGKDPKPERFWLILIALLQGFRLGSIVALTKNDILRIKGVLGFQIRVGKTKSTLKFYPMNDCLILLGFVEWVWSLERENLFQDNSDQASKWYNRVDRNEDGEITWAGFEYSHVTKDRAKCLHSLRHSYGGEVYAITEDIKATAELMGHAPPVGRVTNRYIGVARIPARKAILDKLDFQIDLDRLEARAQELFGIAPPTYLAEQ